MNQSSTQSPQLPRPCSDAVLYMAGLTAALLWVSLFGLLATPAAFAQSGSAPGVYATSPTTATEDLLSDRFVFELGTFVVSSSIKGSLSGAANPADQAVDFDKQFGTDAYYTRWRFDGLWRITERQHLRFMYFDNDITRTRGTQQPIDWGDYSFTGNVTAQVKYRISELSYEFAFLRRRDFEVSASAGIHYDDTTLKLSGMATVTTPSGPVMQNFATKTSSVPAPLPVIGLRGDWAASPHIYLGAYAQLFGLSYNGVSGNWSELLAGVSWMFNDHFGIGIGYNRFDTYTDLNKGSFSGRLRFGYQGGLIYVKGGF